MFLLRCFSLLLRRFFPKAEVETKMPTLRFDDKTAEIEISPDGTYRLTEKGRNSTKDWQAPPTRLREDWPSGSFVIRIARIRDDFLFMLYECDPKNAGFIKAINHECADYAFSFDSTLHPKDFFGTEDSVLGCINYPVEIKATAYKGKVGSCMRNFRIISADGTHEKHGIQVLHKLDASCEDGEKPNILYKFHCAEEGMHPPYTLRSLCYAIMLEHDTYHAMNYRANDAVLGYETENRYYIVKFEELSISVQAFESTNYLSFDASRFAEALEKAEGSTVDVKIFYKEIPAEGLYTILRE